MTTMYDSTSAAAIPDGATLCAGYVDGQWPSYAAMVQRFPHATVVSITVKGQAGVRVADCEPGAMWPPAAAAQWAKVELDHGRRPTVYCSVATLVGLESAFGAADVAKGGVDLWVADWTGQPHLYPGAVATQYASDQPGATTGTVVDLSLTNGVWPAQPLPPTPPPTEDDMLAWRIVPNFPGGGQYLLYDGKMMPLPTNASAESCPATLWDQVDQPTLTQLLATYPT